MKDEDRLELQKAALEYIDQTGTFLTIREKCRSYSSQQQVTPIINIIGSILLATCICYMICELFTSRKKIYFRSLDH